MPRSHVHRILGVVALLVAAATWSAPARAATTLDNLQAAYDGETNAHARYLAFAKKADEEGFGKAAALFRAAARAEEIHAGNHAAVIRKLGGTPRAEVASPEIGSTAENLKTAAYGETYEFSVMYPGFLRQARAERNRDAVRTLNMAYRAEQGHGDLFQSALADLESWRGDRGSFYVCPVCGNTVSSLDFTKCPTCYTKSGKFLSIG